MSTMRFANGASAHTFIGGLNAHEERRLVVVGGKNVAVLDDGLTVDTLQLHPHKADRIAQAPVAAKADTEPVGTDPLDPVSVQCRHFLECLAGRQRPRTDGRSGARVLEVLESLQQSLGSGGAPVRLTTAAEMTRAYEAHPTATLDPGCEIGEGTRIWHYSHVMTGARIGRNCVLGQNVFVASKVAIGDRVRIQNNVSVFQGVVLEEDVFCGPSMVFTNDLRPRSHISRKNEFLPTLVRRGATIGANATVICGHTIGRHAFIAAGAVVTRDVPDYALMIGVPARVAGWVCRCGVRLPLGDGPVEEQAACPECAQSYRRVGEMVAALDGSTADAITE